MSLGSGIKSALKALGKNNNPAYVVVAIATVKGICRPMFTMMDKNESPETKKYAALREGLTEVIAIPTYLTCGALAGKGAALFKDPAKSEIAKHNLRFAGVCAAALFVIPGLCSLVIKPFTDKILGKQPDKKPNTKNLDITSKVEEPALKNPIAATGKIGKLPLQQPVSISTFTNSGMRVG